MSYYYIGIDLSTQSAKAVVIDETLAVVHEAAVSFSTLTRFDTKDGVVFGPNGSVTSPVLIWVAALDELLDKLRSSVDLSKTYEYVAASGQQHGSVYWKKGAASTLANLDPSQSLEQSLSTCFSVAQCPIWMDTSTSNICKELEERVGGAEKLARMTGSRAYERFTINQIAKIARNNPKEYLETERISLVSSFVASVLSGKYAGIDAADASGMNCMDITTQDWIDEILEMVENPKELRKKLGRVVDSSSVVGPILKYFSARYGFSANCQVIASSGDNPCSLAGLRLKVGEVAVSLGTSDTIFGPLVSPLPSSNGHIMINPIDSKTFMSMVVFSNGSLTREYIRDTYADKSWTVFNEYLNHYASLLDGYIGIYYKVPEITPSLPAGIHLFSPTAEKIGAFPQPSMNVRAIIESQFLSMYIHSRDIGIVVNDRIIATGGASKNLAILQVLGDVFGVPVSTFDLPNSAALGAAYRALHGLKKISNPNLSFFDVIKAPREYISTILPNKERHSHYQVMVAKYRDILNDLKK